MWLPIGLCKSHKSGLTLVELLLAVSLFAALMGAVAGLVIAAARAQASWGRSVEPSQQMERAFMHLQRDVEAAQPLFAIPCVLSPDGQRLELARVMPHAAAPGWVKVVYRFVPDEAGTTLVREEFAWGALDGEPQRSETLAMLEQGVFAFGRLASDGTLEWATDWQGDGSGTPMVPQMLKMDWTLPSVGAQPPLSLSRAFRHPAGALPTMETP